MTADQAPNFQRGGRSEATAIAARGNGFPFSGSVVLSVLVPPDDPPSKILPAEHIPLWP